MAGKRLIPKKTYTDAVAYITSVKKAFLAEPAKYKEFLKIFSDVRAHGVDIGDVILRMERVLKDRQELLCGFMVYLPPFAELNFPPEATISCRISYVLAVREAFLAEPAKYDEFVNLFRDFNAQTLDVDNFIAKVETLFKDHQNLLLGFIRYLPQPQKTISPEGEQRTTNFLAKLKTSFQGDDLHVFESFHEILVQFKEGTKPLKEVKREVVELLQGRDDLVMEATEFFSGGPVEMVKYINRLLQL